MRTIKLGSILLSFIFCILGNINFIYSDTMSQKIIGVWRYTILCSNDGLTPDINNAGYNMAKSSLYSIKFNSDGSAKYGTLNGSVFNEDVSYVVDLKWTIDNEMTTLIYKLAGDDNFFSDNYKIESDGMGIVCILTDTTFGEKKNYLGKYIIFLIKVETN